MNLYECNQPKKSPIIKWESSTKKSWGVNQKKKQFFCKSFSSTMQELDESLSKLESANNLSEPVAEAAEEAKTLEEKHIKQAKCLGFF